MRIADCGMRIEKGNPKNRNPQLEIRNSKFEIQGADAF